MSRPRVTSQLTTTQVAKHFGMSQSRLINWVELGAFPPPTSIDENGVRYFDQEWRRKAREILESKWMIPKVPAGAVRELPKVSAGAIS